MKIVWALSEAEIQHIWGYFQREEVQSQRISLGLSKSPTDVEEIIAQTWSEHCKTYKIFAADVFYEENIENEEPILTGKSRDILSLQYLHSCGNRGN